MERVELNSRADGKGSLTLSKHRNHVIRIRNPHAMPYKSGSQRARAWQVVSLMDGLTVEDGHQILRLLEPNIQGKLGRPLGWVVDAVDAGYAEILPPNS